MLVSKRKRYLSGSDWVINTLDSMMRSVYSSGNICQVVLLLNTPLPEQMVRERLNHFVKQFPVLQGRLARDIKLTPFWKIPASIQQSVLLKISHIPASHSPAFLLPELEQNANRPFPDGNGSVDFHLFTSGERAALAMRFDHRLFDARGAESFLQLFHKSLHDASFCGDITFTSSMELTEWKSKFLAGRNVNRAVIALAQATTRSLPLPPVPVKGCRYRLLTFDREETAVIYEKAYRDAGYLMESPFLLAVITRALHELGDQRTGSGSCYLIPATVDLRTGKQPLQEIFFNHVSYLFYQIPVERVANFKELITLVKQQMYAQVKSGFAKDLATASLLTRIAPLALLARLLYFPMKGKIASFAFSHLGKSSFQADELMGSPIANIYHMPRVPVQPGLGFFSSLYREQLTLVISFLDGILADEEVDKLAAGIRRGLGVGAEA